MHLPFIAYDATPLRFAIYTRFAAKILISPSLEKFLAAPMVRTQTDVLVASYII